MLTILKKRLELYEIVVENEDLWLDKSFLDWDSSVQVNPLRYLVDNLEERNNKTIHLPYNYLAHASKKINRNNDSFDRADIISNLKRAVDHRITELNKIYKLKKLAKMGFLDPKLGSRDSLVALGLMRKTLANNLFDLRNIIEHQYGEGPLKERCEEFIDFSWYFLRSTDIFMKEILEVFKFSSLHTFLKQGFQSEIEVVWETHQ